MTKSLPFVLLAGGSLLSATAAFAAATPHAKPTPMMTPSSVPAGHGMMAAPAAKPAPKMAMASARPTTRTAARGRMVTARLANGKTVTYDCSLAGNRTKTACR